MAVGTRREGRERALSLLYEAEAKDITPSALLEELPVPPDAFITKLVLGVEEHQDEIDQLISKFARDWPLERMPAIDRTLLRMGTLELAYRPDVPTGAAISEAVELAKTYSTEESGRFVNGVLGSVAAEVRPPARD